MIVPPESEQMLNTIIKGKSNWMDGPGLYLPKHMGADGIRFADVVCMHAATLERVCEYFKRRLTVEPHNALFGMHVITNNVNPVGYATFLDKYGVLKVEQLYDEWDRVLYWKEVCEWATNV